MCKEAFLEKEKKKKTLRVASKKMDNMGSDSECKQDQWSWADHSSIDTYVIVLCCTMEWAALFTNEIKTHISASHIQYSYIVVGGDGNPNQRRNSMYTIRNEARIDSHLLHTLNSTYITIVCKHTHTISIPKCRYSFGSHLRAHTYTIKFTTYSHHDIKKSGKFIRLFIISYFLWSILHKIQIHTYVECILYACK